MTRLTPIRTRAVLSLAVLAAALVPGRTLAQSQTGTGGGPTSTATAPHTSAVGKTKPPGAAAGAGTADDRRERTPQQVQDDKISGGICIGCGPK